MIPPTNAPAAVPTTGTAEPIAAPAIAPSLAPAHAPPTAENIGFYEFNKSQLISKKNF